MLVPNAIARIKASLRADVSWATSVLTVGLPNQVAICENPPSGLASMRMHFSMTWIVNMIASAAHLVRRPSYLIYNLCEELTCETDGAPSPLLPHLGMWLA